MEPNGVDRCVFESFELMGFRMDWDDREIGLLSDC